MRKIFKTLAVALILLGLFYSFYFLVILVSQITNSDYWVETVQETIPRPLVPHEIEDIKRRFLIDDIAFIGLGICAITGGFLIFRKFTQPKIKGAIGDI